VIWFIESFTFNTICLLGKKEELKPSKFKQKTTSIVTSLEILGSLEMGIHLRERQKCIVLKPTDNIANDV
jgi:hypothetical protein